MTDIFHMPGDLLFVADSLSRPCSTAIPADQIRKCYLVETHVSSSVEAMLSSDNSPNVDLRRATETDADSQRCVNYIQNDWPSDNRDLSEELKLFLVSDKLTYSHGVIFMMTACMYHTRYVYAI